MVYKQYNYNIKMVFLSIRGVIGSDIMSGVISKKKKG